MPEAQESRSAEETSEAFVPRLGAPTSIDSIGFLDFVSVGPDIALVSCKIEKGKHTCQSSPLFEDIGGHVPLNWKPACWPNRPTERVVVTYGETVILATVKMLLGPAAGIDFSR